MPKAAKKLTKKDIDSYCNTFPQSEDGTPLKLKRYADGGVPGLYLKVSATSLGGGTWFFRQQSSVNGNSPFERKLGYYPIMGLSEARKKALMMKAELLTSSTVSSKKVNKSLTLAEAAELWFTHAKNVKHYKDDSNVEIERRRLQKHVLNSIGDLPIKQISRAKVSKALKPIWDKARTVLFVLTTLRHIFRYAIFVGELTPDKLSELDIRILQFDLGKLSKDVQHYPALPVDQLPDFITALKQSDDLRSFLFEFQILCALRPDNARMLCWYQVHLGENPYILFSKNNMKVASNGNFKVPLSDRCVIILNEMQKYRRTDLPLTEQFVFSCPSMCYSKPWPKVMLFKFFRQLHLNKKNEDGIGWIDPIATENLAAERPNDHIEPISITAHGTARTGFRMWASRQAELRYKAVELCLHHRVGSKVENVYDRSDYFEERQVIMQKWANFLNKKLTTKT